MATTFEVVGNLKDFGKQPRKGVLVQAIARPGIKVGDDAVYSNAFEFEPATTDAQGDFVLPLVSLVGLVYDIDTPYDGAINPVTIYGYTPGATEADPGVELVEGTQINIKNIVNEDPAPTYGALVFAGPTPDLRFTVATGAPGTDAEVSLSGTALEPIVALTIPRGDQGETGEDSVVPGPPGPPPELSFTVETGAPGSEATATASGPAATPTVALVIPRGDKGEDSEVPGPPGPPPALTFSATASAPGSDADAEVSGPAATPHVALTLPRGEVGPQGYSRYLVQDGATYPARPFPVEVPVTFVGSANPDTLGVMVVGDSWINTDADQVVPYVKHYDGAGSPEGVVAAQIGSRYIDVNATCGAVEWTKMSGSGNTGWRVTRGDTGWRDVPMHASFTGNLLIRRIDNDVFALAKSINCSAKTTHLMWGLPVWCWPIYQGTGIRSLVVGFYNAASDGVANAFVVRGGALELNQTATDIRGMVRWRTGDADPNAAGLWPTTLPGTAA